MIAIGGGIVALMIAAGWMTHTIVKHRQVQQAIEHPSVTRVQDQTQDAQFGPPGGDEIRILRVPHAAWSITQASFGAPMSDSSAERR